MAGFSGQSRPIRCRGPLAAKCALDHGMKALAVIYVNNDFGVNLVSEFRRAYRGAGWNHH